MPDAVVVDTVRKANSVRIKQEVRAAIEVEAKRAGRSMNSIINEMLEQVLRLRRNETVAASEDMQPPSD